jgi:hypothetical protein
MARFAFHWALPAFGRVVTAVAVAVVVWKDRVPESNARFWSREAEPCTARVGSIIIVTVIFIVIFVVGLT